jgi:hypothetical protein
VEETGRVKSEVLLQQQTTDILVSPAGLWVKTSTRDLLNMKHGTGPSTMTFGVSLVIFYTCSILETRVSLLNQVTGCVAEAEK